MTYLNVFNYEPRRRKIGIDEKENNVTRAFLTTLQNCPSFSKNIFSKLNIPIQKDIKYIFQTNEKEVNTLKGRPYRYFLYISKQNSIEVDGDTQTNNPLPDGLITDSKNIILIEAKVNAPIDKSQKKLYKEIFFKNNCIEKELTWEEIHLMVKNYVIHNKLKLSEIELFILSEFQKYLEVINLNSFDGITFFNKENNYDKILAKEMLKQLRIEYPKFKHISIYTSKRPLEGNWDPIHILTKEKNKTHYTISMNESSFNIDVMTFGKIGKKIIKDHYKRFTEQINKLANNSEYYLELIDYHKVKNKRLDEGKNHVQRGKDYCSLQFLIQLSKLVKQKDWEKKLKRVMEIHFEAGIKNLQIKKQYLYFDEYYQKEMNLSDKLISLKEIEDTFIELREIYLLFSNCETN